MKMAVALQAQIRRQYLATWSLSSQVSYMQPSMRFQRQAQHFTLQAATGLLPDALSSEDLFETLILATG